MSEPLARARRVVAFGAAALAVVLVALAAAAWRLVEAEKTDAAARGRIAAASAVEDFVRALVVEGESRRAPRVLLAPSGEIVTPVGRGFDAAPPLADEVSAFYIRQAPTLGPTLGRAALRRALTSRDASTRTAAAAEGVRWELRDGTGRAAEWAKEAAKGPTLPWGTHDAELVRLADPPQSAHHAPTGEMTSSYSAIVSTAVAAVGSPDETDAVAMLAQSLSETWPGALPLAMRDIRARRAELAEARVLADAFRRTMDVDGRSRAALFADGDAATAAAVEGGWAVVRLPARFVQDVARRTFAPRAMRLVAADASTFPIAVDAPGGSGWAVVASFAEDESRSRSAGALLAGLGAAGLAATLAFVAFARSVHRDARLSTLRTEFVATVSHELRTPVAVVRTSAETLASGRATKDEDRQALTAAIVRESERLSGLLGNVLDFARMEAGRRAYEMRETDVGALLRDVAKRFDDVDVEVADGLPPLRCDADALAGAVGNLLDNARKYAPGGRAAIRASASATSLVVEVADHGIGVPDREKPHVFDRFFRGADPRVRETRGAGIGLALVQHAAEAHGGRVEIVDTPGGGATFRIVLPRGEDG